jgi:ELWxxDGT repeat protein
MSQPAILFAAGTALGRELWFTDGTADGTRLVKDIDPAGSSNPYGFTALGDGRMLFAASTAATSTELWVSDGTEAGTLLIRDIYPGAVSSALNNFRAIGDGRVLFSAYDANLDAALWVSDGTSVGTQKLIDFYPGPFTSFISIPGPRTSPGRSTTFLEPQGFTQLGDGRFVFGAGVEGFQTKLFVTDGTVAGTTAIDVIPPTLSPTVGNLDLFAQLGAGRAVFRANSGDGLEPWVTDGTASGTFLLSDILPGGSSYPNGFTALGNGRAIFFATGPGNDPVFGTGALWATDGTVAGTVRISDIRPGLPDYIARLGDGRVVFAANDTANGLEPFVTDGTAEGTRLIRDIRPGPNWSDPKWFASLDDGRVIFQADDGVTGRYELWVTDGTANGTVLLGDLDPRPFFGSSPNSFYRLGDGRTVFNATVGTTDAELWITDGSTAGTALLKDISSTTPVIVSGGVLFSNGRSDPAGFTSFTVPGVTLDGNDSANTIRGQDGHDVLLGAGGDDRLIQSRGNDIFDGGPGFDRLDATAMGFRGATFSRAGGDTILRQSGQTDTLRGIEQVDFADGRLIFDATNPAAQVTRLYQAGLARLPDQVGLNGWIAQLQSGGALTDVARGFSASAEFTNRFGAGLSNGQYVDQLYQNVLGRAGEAAGRQGWVDFLGRGASREQVLVGFSESPENQARTQPLVDAGIWDLSENAARVARLYDAIMGRLPDVSGMNTWRAALDGGTSLVDVTRGFTGSAEFAARYGNPNDTTFVTLLYRNTLEREPEAGGLAYWTGELDRDVSRAEVIIGFSESAEEIALTKPVIMNEAPGSFGILFA